MRRSRRRSSVVLAGLLLAAGLNPAGPALAVPDGGPVAVATVPGTPWELAVVPAGGTFVVQRDGGIAYLDEEDRLQPRLALERTAIPNVRKLLGFALAPDFASSGLAYLYVGQHDDRNGIWRLRASGGSLTVVDKVFGGIASDGSHDGGRMVFGPDGHLYVSTGDIHQPSLPQDVTSLNGKILRLAVPPTGLLTAPVDNPYAGGAGGAPWVWSIGHRHPQGLAFDAAGRLWETEHGPTGEPHGSSYPGADRKTGRDELNLIVKGGNYGWPLVSGPMTGTGLIPPVAVAGDSPAWAPGDLAVGADGSLYAPFLAGTELHRFDVRNGAVFAHGTHLTGLGRLRVAVARGADLLVAQDQGSGAVIYRLPLGAPIPGGSDAATPPTGPQSSPPTGPPTGPQTPGSSEATATQARTRALSRKVRAAVRELGRSRLTAGRVAKVASRSPSAGRTVVSVRLRSVTGPMLARSRTTSRASERERYRVGLSEAGRERLGAAPSRVVVVGVVHRSAAGAAYVASHLLRFPRTSR